MNNSAEESKNHPPEWAGHLIDVFVVLGIIAVSSLIIFNPARQPSANPDTASLAPPSLNLCDDKNDGYLRGRLYGALDEQIDWSGAEMDCEGMLRPDADGIRLLFSAQKANDAKLVFVFGIDGKIDTLLGKERPANITIIDEMAGRFFSSGGQDRCWATIQKIENISDDAPVARQIAGELYCAGGIPSLSDNRSVTLGDFEFSGRLALDES